MAFILDALLLIILLAVTVLIAREGLWGAALVFFDVLFAGILAFGTFEAIGGWMERQFWLAGFPRFIALVGVFVGSLSLLRFATDKLAPRRVKFQEAIEQGLKWLFALATGFIATGIVACMLQVAPVNKEIFRNDFRRTMFGVRPDAIWITVVRWSTLYAFPWDPEHAFPDADTFWREYYEFRPFGAARVGR